MQRSFYSQTYRESRNAKHTGASAQWNGHITCSSIQKIEKLEVINSLVICVICWARPYQAPKPQPGPEVASNLTFTLPVQLGAPQTLQAGPEMSNSPFDPYRMYD